MTVAVLAAHGAGVLNAPTFDDHAVIKKASRATVIGSFTDRNVQGSSPVGAYYRPLRTLIFRLILALPGPSVLYLHLLSLLAHLAVVVALFYLCRIAGASEGIALLGSLFFAVHPANTEAVAGITNVKESLTTLFTAFVLHRLWSIGIGREGTWRTALAIAVVTLLALSAKETGLVAAGLAVALPVVYRDRWKQVLAKGSAPAIAVTLAFSALLFVIPSTVRGPYVLDDLLVTLLTTCAAFVVYARIIIWPVGLSVRHDIEPITSLVDWHVLAVFVVLLCAIVVGLKWVKKKDHRAVPLIFLLASLLPICNLLPLRGSVMSERYVYMPLFALVLLVASIASRKELKADRVEVKVAAAGLLVLLAVLSTLRTRQWRDDRTLFESAVKIAPDTLAVHWKLFQIYRKANDRRNAVRHYRQMLRINRLMAMRYVRRAEELHHQGKKSAAASLWNRAEYTASKNPPLLREIRRRRAITNRSATPR